MDRARLLIADDDPVTREVWLGTLLAAGHEVDTAATGEEVVEKTRAKPYDLLICDLVFPPTSGIEVLKEIKRVRPATLVVIVSASGAVDPVLEAFRAGAFDFLTKPIPAAALLDLAERALQTRRMGEERRRIALELESERLTVVQLRQQLGLDDPFQRIIGQSARVASFVDTLREVARTESTVLLTGESGTGKSLIARTIHDASARAKGPFVEANCVVYSEGVLQSELFGHERGAFTGAAKMKRGRFELAHGGTLFLDEIGEIPAATQLALLRVLNDRVFERVGGEETIEADVRLIAATNRDLEDAIRQGSFRSDLYYRLNVIPIHLPPLREHSDDIPVLIQHFLAACAGRLNRSVPEVADDAMDALVRYPWPGNVRELENVVERTMVLSRSGKVELRDLPAGVRAGMSDVFLSSGRGTLADLERHRILDALDQARGNKKLAAAQLGIHRSTLYAKLRRYGLLDADPPGKQNGSSSEGPQPLS